MIESLQRISFIILFLSCCFSVNNVYGVSNDEEWESKFIQQYSHALNTQDSDLYKSFVISQLEIDSLLQYLEITAPNCITDMERNLKEEKLKNQFSQLKYYTANIRHIEILNSYTIAGCGNVKGIKINLKCECVDNMIRHRTLTFIAIQDIHKLLFDIEKN